jgi:uncharacterized repeat protein (TIGR03837 family)
MLWDIFCRVIDNYGDIGVGWRLCADLAARGHSVRLWVDDSSALRWMAPGALEGNWPQVQVLAWELSSDTDALHRLPHADVWIEAFGCEIAPAFVAHFAQKIQQQQPVWLNLEYLSAEPYVERSHGLPSPVMQGPAKGWTKHFFYPGFSSKTGGLLREPGLAALTQGPSQASERGHFLQQLGIRCRQAAQATATVATPLAEAAPGERLVCLFCYEPPLLAALLDHWAASPCPVRLLVTPGRASHAVQALLGRRTVQGALQISYLPTLSQADFDRLLRHCDLNLVRGEDSLVRALWAGKPLVWQIYPQDDQAHRAKLEAFLEQMQWSAALCQVHHAWNGLLPPAEAAAALLPLAGDTLLPWRSEVQAARARLLEMDDLGNQLIEFVQKNR